MNKYIVIAFGFLGFWFYEASGGADFEPGDNKLVVFAEPRPVAPRSTTDPNRVARADSSVLLTDVVPARVDAAPQSADATAGLALVSLETPAERTAPVVQTAEPASAESVTPDAVVEPVRDLRFVDGDRVNMRGGPGTEHAVVGRLLRDDMVEILEDNGNGWLRLRDTASGQEGWMADWLVTASN